MRRWRLGKAEKLEAHGHSSAAVEKSDTFCSEWETAGRLEEERSFIMEGWMNQKIRKQQLLSFLKSIYPSKSIYPR